MTNYDFRSKCGKGRGCRVVQLPNDDKPVDIIGSSKFNIFHIHPVSFGRSPHWEVVRWDVEPVTDLHRKTAG